MVSLVDLLSNTYGPVQMMMLPYLDVADVIALTRTCKGFGQLQDVLQATAYNVDRFLQNFFSDPVAFRSLQGRCGALLSGKAVRNFFQRLNPTDRLICVFVPESHAEPMTDYLNSDGYVTEKGKADSYLKFVRLGANGQKSRLDLFTSKNAAVAQAFRHLSVTASMNFLAWNKAYAVFPYTSFIKRESYLLTKFNDEWTKVLAVLSQEGLRNMSVSWSQRENLDELSENLLQDKDGDDTRELVRRRRIGDKHTWVMNLCTRNAIVPKIPTAVLESTTFRLRIPNRYFERPTVARYKIDFDTSIRHPILKYEYVTLGEDTRDDGQVMLDESDRRMRTSYYSRKCEELIDRLNELTIIELVQVAVSKRPPQYAALKQHIDRAADTRGKFDLPTTWTFYDDYVIAYLDKAWATQQKIDKAEEAARKARFNRSILDASALHFE